MCAKANRITQIKRKRVADGWSAHWGRSTSSHIRAAHLEVGRAFTTATPHNVISTLTHTHRDNNQKLYGKN